MIKPMIQFFYHFAYEIPTNDVESSEDSTSSNAQAEIITHAKMFAVAIKYHIDGLRIFSRRAFRTALHTEWSSDGFAEAITIVFTSTPKDATDLRDMVLDKIHDQFPTLKDKPEVEQAINSTPGLAFAMLKRKCDGRTVKEETKFQCAVCHQSKEDDSPAVLKICEGCKSTPQLPSRTRVTRR